MNKKPQKIIGTVYDNNGYWYWRGIIPGEIKRTVKPLCMPGSHTAMRSSHPREVAEAAMWRIIEAEAKKKKFERTRPKDAITVHQLCDKYAEYSKEYYRRPDGTPTSTAAANAIHVRLFRELFGDRYIAELEHHDMLTLRDALIDSGISRTTVNERMATVKRMITWALDEDLIYAQTKAELTQVSTLKRNRSRARETDPVTAVVQEYVDAVIAAVPECLGHMIRVNELTGMRPEEICSMRWADIERRDDVWIYRPQHWKTEHLGQPRAVVIGPRAINLIVQHEGESDYVFSAAVANMQYLKKIRELRKSKVQPSQVDRSIDNPLRIKGDHYTVDSYRRAVTRKCASLGIPEWTPNQLRHNCATNIRRAFGIDAAGAVLGHSLGMRITNRYSFEAAEDELIAKAVPPMVAMG